MRNYDDWYDRDDKDDFKRDRKDRCDYDYDYDYYGKRKKPYKVCYKYCNKYTIRA